MVNKNQLEIIKDLPNKKMVITRNFDADREDVWRAWTEPELLDLWWAPQPWRTETSSMDFRKGGSWLYSMVGPAGERHYCRVNYTNIKYKKNFDGIDCFCDENGNPNEALPLMKWKNDFLSTPDGTTVVVTVLFDKEADLNTIIEMGFEAGFTAALINLEQYLKARIQLKNEMGHSVPRVSTYLNFPGNTEEAFLFYRKIFRSEFNGRGIERFADIPGGPKTPPVPESIKNLVLHVELPILGGHVLMATDAPKEMGFDLTTGNNMHICLEPSTRAETKRLFDELSADGIIIMPLEDMFFGSYFGSCTDKFGINWMFSCGEKK